MHIPSGLMDVSINCIRPSNNNEILIATDGAGVYKMNTDTYESIPVSYTHLSVKKEPTANAKWPTHSIWQASM